MKQHGRESDWSCTESAKSWQQLFHLSQWRLIIKRAFECKWFLNQSTVLQINFIFKINFHVIFTVRIPVWGLEELYLGTKRNSTCKKVKEVVLKSAKNWQHLSPRRFIIKRAFECESPTKHLLVICGRLHSICWTYFSCKLMLVYTFFKF